MRLRVSDSRGVTESALPEESAEEEQLASIPLEMFVLKKLFNGSII